MATPEYHQTHQETNGQAIPTTPIAIPPTVAAIAADMTILTLKDNSTL